MKAVSLLLLQACCAAGAARAQEAPLTVSLGLKAWSTEWSTFTYRNSQAVPADLVSGTFFIPSVVARWRDYYLSASGFQKSYGNGTSRHEWDMSAGWVPMTGVALGLGYKFYAQRDGDVRYEPKGPIASASAALPIAGAWSLYASLGLGWLKTPRSGSGNIVKFDPGPYRISEVGFGYGLPVEGFVRSMAVTAGYRTQVLVSNGIQADGSGRFNDLTQGLTLGVTASF